MDYVKLFLAVALFVSGAAFGWTINGWKHDSIELAATQAATVVAEVQARRESKIAADVLKAIRNEEFKERIIEKHIREVTKREIYKTECIDDDGLAIVNGVYSNVPSSPKGSPPSGAPDPLP